MGSIYQHSHASHGVHVPAAKDYKARFLALAFASLSLSSLSTSEPLIHAKVRQLTYLKVPNLLALYLGTYTRYLTVRWYEAPSPRPRPSPSLTDEKSRRRGRGQIAPHCTAKSCPGPPLFHAEQSQSRSPRDP